MSSPAQPPPHHPTYIIHLSQDQIAGIVRVVFPDYKLENIQRLGHGKSFNNRIYFLDLAPLQDHSRHQKQLVLKVCGHYFGPRKVQNEVGALLLLDQFSPTVPAPKILAWSEDGKSIESLRGDQVEALSDIGQSWQSQCGWILISRLPGRPIQPSDLDDQHHSCLLQRLAQHVFTWRTSMPELMYIGNIRFDMLASHSLPLNIKGTHFVVGGSILSNKYNRATHYSWSDYYQSLLQDKYDHLISAPVLGLLAQRIAEPVSRFLPMVLRLPFLVHSSVKLTHMDLPPRNILISEDASRSDLPQSIPGIVDWEFAAFLPSPMEWLNSLVNQLDDWPEQHYKLFLSHVAELERQRNLAVDLPVIDPPALASREPKTCICPYHTFKHRAVLERAIDHVAPWWTTPNAYVGREAELGEECEIAAKVVLDCLERLQASLTEIHSSFSPTTSD